ncbi:4-hydroxy-2-oxovalerate aldolase [Breznakia sp. PF5-3]|uniref:4-hydroxy-2-oxovalerate aldolase n=1 Tax=unclassified Breznakia TaxID=2623764 RepID=UPI002406FF27|nr:MULTISPECIES: 4-hydroxy-2-oxovalerate aldolase [unclassified Breznakia]MDF9825036.1 4-hydroxy-2-oxovalerate aldolase [Breznakia sp. PM6-1]MDF9835883.1 4-hydroxy-2-oxovalerate aldolase [Breznakia sp. PF5-3]MDL2276218.1 4-hydroxy-2-oxovalerate aldolase [Breznakia sp. OttesenSCG-928-G09]
MTKRIHVVDTTLRDGSHAIGHSFSCEEVRKIAGGLDACGVEFIELSHGDGIQGSSYNYGFIETSEIELLKSANEVIKNGKLTVLLLPGIGTVEDLKYVHEHCGVKAVRVATHVTEADISKQHIEAAKALGMTAVGFLMLAHMATPEKVAEQAKLMESYGADYINIADSAGHLLPENVKAIISKVCEEVSIPVGFHAHNNLALAMGNTLAAIEAGATYVDGTLCGLGAGAGNTQLEVLAGVLDLKGYDTKLNFYGLMDIAKDVVTPLMKRPQIIDETSLMVGYAGVYSSFFLHVKRAAEKFQLEPRDILVELGKRKMVGGQEDMIIDVAYQLSLEK